MKFHLGVFILILLSASAWAQNYEAVIERLKKSVEAGEISERQAWSMVSALKKSSPAEIRLEHYGRELKAAVKAGKMTEKEAWGKWEMAEAKAKGSAVTDRPNWDQIKKRIEGAVERGDMTRDQANKKYEALEAKFKEGQRRTKEENNKLRNNIRKKQEDPFNEEPLLGLRIVDPRASLRGGSVNYSANLKRILETIDSDENSGFQYFPGGTGVTIGVSKSDYSLGKEVIKLDQLVITLKKRKDMKTTYPIGINVNMDVSMERVLRVFNLLEQAGYKKIHIVAKPTKIQLEPKGGVGYGSGRLKSDR